MSAVTYSYDKHANVVELSKSDCKVLLPLLQKAVKPMQKRYDHYKDIHESGEASERQQDALCETEEALTVLGNVIDDLQTILR